MCEWEVKWRIETNETTKCSGVCCEWRWSDKWAGLRQPKLFCPFVKSPCAGTVTRLGGSNWGSERELYAIFFVVVVLQTLLFGTCKTLVISFHKLSLSPSLSFLCVVFGWHYGLSCNATSLISLGTNLWRHQRMLMFYTSNVHISICSEHWAISLLLPPSLHPVAWSTHVPDLLAQRYVSII